MDTKKNNGGENQPVDQNQRYLPYSGGTSQSNKVEKGEKPKGIGQLVQEGRIEKAQKQTADLMNKPINDKTQKLLDSMKEDKTPIAGSSKYLDSSGKPIDYDKNVSGKRINELKDVYNKALLLTNNRFVDFDSFVEAYKNYSINDKEYGRGPFMKMIKRQTDEGIKKRYAERNRDEFNSLVKKNPKSLDTVNNYVKEKNTQLATKALEIRNTIKSNEKQINKIDNLLNSGTLSNLDFSNMKKQRKTLITQNQKHQKNIDELKKQVIPMAKDVNDMLRMFNNNPVDMLKLLRDNTVVSSNTPTKPPVETEEQKAMKLLLGSGGGTK